MQLGRFNHIGVAVPDIDDAIAFYRDVLGASDITEPFDLPEQGVKVCFVDTPTESGYNGTQIELIEPLSDASPIAGFLAKNPKGGIHHICIEVEDIDAACEKMNSEGVTITGTGKPKIGAHGKPVVFLHPKDMNGTLVELEQA